MKPENTVHVKVLRSTIASGVTLAEGTEAYISPTDYKTLHLMGKVVPIPVPEPAEDAPAAVPASEEPPAEDAPAKGKGKK